jgi:hypothetical protein
MTKLVRLALLVGVMALFMTVSERRVGAASYCCDTCMELEHDFNSQCPGGAGDSDDCANMAWSINHCWNFCNFELCEGYPYHPFCDFFNFGRWSYYVCF